MGGVQTGNGADRDARDKGFERDVGGPDECAEHREGKHGAIAEEEEELLCVLVDGVPDSHKHRSSGVPFHQFMKKISRHQEADTPAKNQGDLLCQCTQ